MILPDLALLLSSGGDARISLDVDSGVNRYGSSPWPRDTLAFASSTANDISADAYAYLERRWGDMPARAAGGSAYAAFLEAARARLRAVYGLPPEIEIAFAASGTDLEYLALMATPTGPGGIANILLGADEVGKGCIQSAAGNYFAQETALGLSCSPGTPVKGLPPVRLYDVPVRNADGVAHDSASLTAELLVAIEQAQADERTVLVHVVHGSKTGLIVPHLQEVDALRQRYGDRLRFVVDACQARITPAAVSYYLARDMIVMLTGSKFMGGPPFSGFALVPGPVVERAAPIDPGMATILRRAEIPVRWAGRDRLVDAGNAGLALRIDAALFELERFSCLDPARVAGVIGDFGRTVGAMADRLGIALIGAAAPVEMEQVSAHPVETQSLVTLDLCYDRGGNLVRSLDFDEATGLHKAMIAQGIRLGQPVHCVRLPDRRWGATLRIGLSMAQVSSLAALNDAGARARLGDDIARIETALATLLTGDRTLAGDRGERPGNQAEAV